MATLEEIEEKTESQKPWMHAPDGREEEGPGEALKRLWEKKKRSASSGSGAADQGPACAK